MRQRVNLLPAVINRQAVRYFDTVDLDKNEELDRQEIKAKAEHILGLIFDTLDADGDGTLLSSEEALTKVKTRVFDNVLDEGFSAFAGNDHKLGPKDFTRFWKLMFTREYGLIKASSWPELVSKLANITTPESIDEKNSNIYVSLIRILHNLAEKVDADNDGEFSKQELSLFFIGVLSKIDKNNDDLVDINELIIAVNGIGILDEANLKRDKIEYEILVSKTKPFFKTFLEMVEDNDELLTKDEVLKILDVNVHTLFEAIESNLKTFQSDWRIFLNSFKDPLPRSRSIKGDLAMMEKVMAWAEEETLSLTLEKPGDTPVIVIVLCVAGLLVLLVLGTALGICLYRRQRRTSQRNAEPMQKREEPMQKIGEEEGTFKDDIYYTDDDYYSEL
eukprot:GFUD01033401.1.p1 GENE.GFUD01033401.1~~GFUD01033401.1.p1  ORF type:complete len:457 (-),score=123.49 GFUD01033401.1:16-1185(-)